MIDKTTRYRGNFQVIYCLLTYSKYNYLKSSNLRSVLKSLIYKCHHIQSFAIRFISENVYVLLGITENIITAGCISQAPCQLFSFWVWSVAGPGKAVDSERKEESRVCVSLSIRSRVFDNSCFSKSPSPSLVLPSPSWFWPLSSDGTTSSPSHSDLGAIVVFCFLISESPYRFSVVCLSSFLICVISSLYQAISDYYLRVVFLVGLFTGCEVLEMTIFNIEHAFLTAIYCINCLSLLSFSNKCEMGRDDETSVGTVFLLIYLSENCQKGSSTKYPFVIMSVWENKAIKSLDRKSSGIFGYQLLSNDKIS